MNIDELIAIIDARAGGDRERRFDAVEQLVAMGSPARAVPAIVRLFARTPSEDTAHEPLAHQLASFGPSILEPVLRVLDVGLDRDTLFLGNACVAFARLGVRDERIFLRIQELYEHHDRWWAAELFGVYGDAKAVPLLREAIERVEPNPEYPDYANEIEHLVEAHGRCGGVLDEKATAHIRARTAQWRRARFSIVGP